MRLSLIKIVGIAILCLFILISLKSSYPILEGLTSPIRQNKYIKTDIVCTRENTANVYFTEYAFEKTMDPFGLYFEFYVKNTYPTQNIIEIPFVSKEDQNVTQIVKFIFKREGAFTDLYFIDPMGTEIKITNNSQRFGTSSKMNSKENPIRLAVNKNLNVLTILLLAQYGANDQGTETVTNGFTIMKKFSDMTGNVQLKDYTLKTQLDLKVHCNENTFKFSKIGVYENNQIITSSDVFRFLGTNRGKWTPVYGDCVNGEQKAEWKCGTVNREDYVVGYKAFGKTERDKYGWKEITDPTQATLICGTKPSDKLLNIEDAKCIDTKKTTTGSCTVDEYSAFHNIIADPDPSSEITKGLYSNQGLASSKLTSAVNSATNIGTDCKKCINDEIGKVGNEIENLHWDDQIFQRSSTKGESIMWNCGNFDFIEYQTKQFHKRNPPLSVSTPPTVPPTTLSSSSTLATSSSSSTLSSSSPSSSSSSTPPATGAGAGLLPTIAELKIKLNVKKDATLRTVDDYQTFFSNL